MQAPTEVFGAFFTPTLILRQAQEGFRELKLECFLMAFGYNRFLKDIINYKTKSPFRGQGHAENRN